MTQSTPKLSLKITIGVFTAVTVLIVAAITLAITLSVSLESLRGIGQHHASAIVGNAEAKFAAHFDEPARALLQMRNFSAGPNVTAPTLRPDTIMRWVDLTCFAYRESEGRFGSVTAWFLDGTLVNCWDEFRDARMFGAYITRVATNATAGTTAFINDGVWYYKDTNKMVPTSDNIYRLGSDISSLEDWRSTGIVSVMSTGTGGGRVSNWASVQVTRRGTIIDVHAAAVAPLINEAGELFGYGTITLTVTALSEFLRSINGTANTGVFAVDRQGILYASSLKTPVFTYTTEPRDTKTKAGCMTSQTLLDVDSPDVIIACRASAATYPYAPLNAAVASEAFYRSDVEVVVFKPVAGEGNFYLVSRPVRQRMGGFGINLILTLPEEDIIGDVVTGRNIAIGVTCVAFVVAVVISSLVIHFLLAPLSVISGRMFKAASFEDDAVDDTEYSSMREIFELQDAYYCMNFELNRVKSFVPQSVLQSKVTIDDLDLDETTGFDEENSTLATERRNSEAQLPHLNGTPLPRPSDTESVRSTRTGRQQSYRPDDVISQRSSQRRRAGFAGVPGSILKTTAGLTSSKISVLMFNLCGFHHRIAQLDIDGILNGFEDMVAAVNREVNENKGVVSYFHGDHFLATFNAVRPCVQHCRRAVATARNLRKTLQRTAFFLQSIASVSVGKAFVGNVGSSELRSFNVVGNVVSQCNVLQHIGKLHFTNDSACLVPEKAFREIESHHRYSIIDLVRLPRSIDHCGTTDAHVITPTLVADVNRDVNAESPQEWLYVVEDTDPMFAFVEKRNTVFRLLRIGRFAEARSLYDDLPEAVHSPVLAALMEQATRANEGDESSVFSNHGALMEAISRQSLATTTSTTTTSNFKTLL